MHGIARAVERAGASRESLYAAAGLDTQQLANVDLWLPRAQLYRLMEAAIVVTGDPAFGLRWAAQVSDSDFAPLSYLAAQCTSMRQVLEIVSQFGRLLTDVPEHALIERDDRVTIRCLATQCAPSHLRPSISARSMGGFWRVLRNVVPRAELMGLTFAHPAPAYADAYRTVFGLRPQFDEAHTSLTFARELMDTRGMGKDDALRESLGALAEQRLLRLTNSTPYAQRVREFLMRSMSAASKDIDAVARALDMSERSLRRRLAEEGTSYMEVWTHARSSLAKTLLDSTRHPLQEVAYQMGFASESAFHRAFKRWTGMSPGIYRAR